VSDSVRNAVGPLFGAAGVQPPATDSLLLKALGIGEYLKPERRVLDCAYVRDCIRTHEPVHVVLITRPTVDHKAIQFNREMQQRLEVEYKSFGTSTKQFLRPSFPGLQMDRCEILSTVADYLPYTELDRGFSVHIGSINDLRPGVLPQLTGDIHGVYFRGFMFFGETKVTGSNWRSRKLPWTNNRSDMSKTFKEE
jgi:hypothetical protein